MDLKKLIANAIEVESLAGGCFLTLHRMFVDDEEASRMFSKFAAEEAEHADVLKRQLALVQTKPEAFTEIDPVMVERQRLLLAKLRALSQRIENESLTLDEALQSCLQMEEGDDKMIEDLKRSLGKMSFGTIIVEALALQKHPNHNLELLNMVRRRGTMCTTPTASDA